ncbi:MAG TPA: U32 family peptidase [Nitrospirae bacterium]|nr:putative protease YhbU precursor [bacterium BMS3Abin06]HDH10733.1 U32 family peptidase [Nitrospirota bacterium]HDZ03021.1 U32 family peptidase [Nitrospirota bacterium]
MKIPELLAPAGNFEKLKTALHYGADAVYMGLSDFSLRAKADNFSEEELKDAVRLVHQKGKKLYITLNIFPHNKDIFLIKEHLSFLKKISPDGLIISDPGILEMASELTPDIPVHISTQANITNCRSAGFWEKSGAKRLVLSRELTIEEIKEIRDNVSLELECFVHGAICISYSGRCYVSSFLSNRSANRGECANSCRWNYALMEEKRPGEYMPVYENDKGTYVMSSRDLCMLEHLDKLAHAGVNSFKIEGRMKGINYVAGVVKTYREAVDALKSRPYRIKKEWLREIAMFSSRGYTTGMFFGKQPDAGYNHDEEYVYRMSHEFVGIVQSVSNGKAGIALRNTLKTGDSIEFLSTGLENKAFKVTEISDAAGVPLDSGRNEETVFIPVQNGVRENDLVRRPLKIK